MDIMNDEPINMGRLIFENMKAMANSKQKPNVQLSIFNNLYRSPGVRSHPNNDMIKLMVPINMVYMCKFPRGSISQVGEDVE